MHLPQGKIIIVAGPTASGKSAFALSLAKKADGVIINADSMQVYADLRILTARPSPEEEAAVPHRLYGVIDGAERCSAMRWRDMALKEVDTARKHGQQPILVGGTGMYLKALIEGMSPIPDIPPQTHQEAMALCREMGPEALHARLATVDPVTAARLEAGDSQRITRAWEVWQATGKPLSYWQSLPPKTPFTREDFHIIRLEIGRQTLYARCDARFDAMMAQGALDEVEGLLARNLSTDLPVMRVIGVPELVDYLRGKQSLKEAALLCKQHTRNYAKRQLTWLRNQLEVDETA